jgi:NAD(P)-dependent dehydrogenase (short-subunit alcohol dehydrogenase family)
MKLKGKVAIVTGAASGIGLASAKLFAHEGARVVVADNDARAGQETVAMIGAERNVAFFAQTDVTKEADVQRMVDATIAKWGRIEILFNNAGVVMVKPLEQMTEEEWDRVMAVNVKAAFFTIKHVVPHMRRQCGGVILNNGSITSFTGQHGTPVYSTSKGAIALLTKSLALDYGRDRIRVNCLCPGITDTPMLREHIGHGSEGEAKLRARLARVPTGEMLSPEDVARAALYLVSDDSVGVTGILHVVDGGLVAASEYNVPL